MEHVALRSIGNTAAFLKDASWHILTIGAEGRARQRLRDLGVILREKVASLSGNHRGAGRPGVALVLGNEETGLPREVKEVCSVLFRIPGSGLMESFNVAQAASLFLHEFYEY